MQTNLQNSKRDDKLDLFDILYGLGVLIGLDDKTTSNFIAAAAVRIKELGKDDIRAVDIVTEFCELVKGT